MNSKEVNTTNSVRVIGSVVRINKLALLDLTCILWICNDLLRLIVNKILSYVSLTGISPRVVSFIIYMPLLCYIYMTGKLPWKKFHWIFLICVFYFSVTLIVNPSYYYWYARSSYGVFDVIFRPDKGAIWAFLIMEIMWSNDRVWHVFKTSMPLLLIYNIFKWAQAQQVGYWEYVNSSGVISTRSYSLEFGYSMAFLLLLSLLFLIRENKKKYLYIVIAAISFVLMINSGSRGSLICVFAFMLLSIVKGNLKTNKKIICFIGIFLITILFIVYGYQIASWMITLMERFGLSSRTLLSILNGQITDDSGRDVIYSIVIGAIKKNPILGYGAYGDRQFVGPSYNWGYSHSIIYEMMIDFGVILGSIFLVVIAYRSIKLVVTTREEKAVSIIMLLISMVSRLFVSDTFWGDQYFWMLLAIIILEHPKIKIKMIR